ncbi:MAG: hypothetical protein ACI4YB_06885 [Oscillospiraceae bacterium]
MKRKKFALSNTNADFAEKLKREVQMQANPILELAHEKQTAVRILG